jgi:hypothetical protein
MKTLADVTRELDLIIADVLADSEELIDELDLLPHEAEEWKREGRACCSAQRDRALEWVRARIAKS